MSEYVAVSALEFADGSIEAFVLARGEGKKCRSVANMVPGISYSGDKPVKSARVVIMKAEDWEALASDESLESRAP